MKKYILFIALIISIVDLHAQSNGHPDKAKLQEYRNNPIWIQMMDDPNVNFHEAVAAFEEFWRDRPEPEELMRGESEEEEENEQEERSDISQKEKEELLKYASEYKRFKFWKIQHEAFLNPDGTIMSQDEIDALVEQELQNRQKSNK